MKKYPTDQYDMQYKIIKNIQKDKKRYFTNGIPFLFYY